MSQHNLRNEDPINILVFGLNVMFFFAAFASLR